MATLIFLMGTRGAGKTSVLNFLMERGRLVLKPSTSRPKRFERENEYFFESEWNSNPLVWEIRVGRYSYGMRKSEVEKIPHDGTAVTVFEPKNSDILLQFKSQVDIEVITVGLDTIKSAVEQQERIGGSAERSVCERELREDREVVLECDVVLSGDEASVCDAVLAVCRILESRGGVVDGENIKAMINGGSLLTRADLDNVQSASYDLRLGSQAWCQGRFIELDRKNPSLRIPAYSYAIVTSEEEASVPRFLIGTYDLTVSGFMDGLVLSNGPQVDPGYRGALFCTLFNGRDVPRGVTIGRHFATMQFLTTTCVTGGYRGRYQGKTELPAFVSENTAVSPGGNIVERIDKLERSIDDKVAPVRAFWWASLSVVIAIHVMIAGILWIGGDTLREILVGRQQHAAIVVERGHDGLSAGDDTGMKANVGQVEKAVTSGPGTLRHGH